MVCGAIGSSAFAPCAKPVSIFNGLITFLAVIFCILGCVSNANNAMSIYALPWQKYTTSFPGKPDSFAAFGIRGFTTYILDDSNKPVFNLNINQCPNPANLLVQLYSDCGKGSCNPTELLPGVPNPLYTVCDKCSIASGGIVGTLVISLLCAMVAFVAFFMRCCKDSLLWKDVSTIAVIAAFGFGVVAYGVASPCKGAIEGLAAFYTTLTGATSVAAYGQGAKIVAGSWSMLLIVSILALLVPAPAPEAAGNTGLANKK